MATVAAPATTAKNHGVLVNHNLLGKLSNGGGLANYCEKGGVDLYLQKPSEAAMRQSDALFSAADCTPKALIDTGVVVFTKSPFQALFLLLEFELSVGKTLGQHMIRFELYHELLCACATSSNQQECFSDFLARIGVHVDVGTGYYNLLNKLWADFHRIPLRLVHVVEGSFHHLGTSQEVLQLLGDRNRVPGLQQVNSCLQWNSTLISDNMTCIQSFVHLHGEASNTSSSELTTLVEHSIVSTDASTFPHGGALSHLYSCFGENVNLPDGFLMQQVFLRPGQLLENNLSILLTLHINDDIKATVSSGTIYGRPWSEFMKFVQCQEQDIWHEACTEKTLWTAKLFPVLHLDDHSRLSYFHQDKKEWMPLEVDDLLCGATFFRRNNNSQHVWKFALRLSLSELLTSADALAMFSWKQLLSSANAVFLDKASWKTWSCLDLVHMCLRKLFTQWCNAQRSMEDLAAALMILKLREKFSSAAQRSDIAEDLKNDSSLTHLLTELYAFSSTDVQILIDEYVQLMSTLELHGGKDNVLFLSKLLSHFFRSFAELNINVCKKIANYLLNLRESLDAKYHPRLLLAVSWIFDHHPALCFSPAKSTVEAHNQQVDATNSLPANSNIIFELFVDALNRISIVGENVEDSQQRVGDYFEMLTQRMVCLHIQWSLAQKQQGKNSSSDHNVLEAFVVDMVSLDKVILAQAPVRIDLVGGWSDTPPICYDQAGSVLNVAIRVDHRHPIRCASRFCDKRKLHLQCWKRFNEESAEKENDIALAGEEICVEFQELQNLSLTASPCALLKACLLALGFLPSHRDGSVTLSEWLREKLGCGIQISCFSDLPAGSGMGGSSILAAAILQSVATLLGKPLSNNSLVYLVSEVEQLLTTGGGWQDQIGGCFPAFKIARSPSQLPLVVDVEPLASCSSFNDLFSDRTFLIYTGQQRLAKNTLINALRTFSVTSASSSDISNFATVNQLRQNAETGFEVMKALENSNADSEIILQRLGEVLSRCVPLYSLSFFYLVNFY